MTNQRMINLEENRILVRTKSMLSYTGNVAEIAALPFSLLKTSENTGIYFLIDKSEILKVLPKTNLDVFDRNTSIFNFFNITCSEDKYVIIETRRHDTFAGYCSIYENQGNKFLVIAQSSNYNILIFISSENVNRCIDINNRDITF